MNSTANASVPLIVADKLSKIYEGNVSVEALKEASISVEEKKFYAIMGSSGSGKSTFLHILGLLDKPTSGNLFFKGSSVAEMAETQKVKLRMQTIGFIFQSFYLLPNLNAWENVCFPMLVNGDIEPPNRKEKALKLLETVDMLHRKDHFPNQLSGGEQQRVAIARSLANDPTCLLADEPTGNVDSDSEDNIINILKDLCFGGRAVIVVTHNQKIADVANEVYYMKNGILKGRKCENN